MGKAHILNYNREIINDRTLNAVIGVLFFILATALGAYVRIPVKGSPVPITLQTFFVILAGAILGKSLGAYSQLGYLLLGAIGLPVFGGCSFGISHILGPTGGYIIGFVFAASFIGKMAEVKRFDIRWIAISFIIGNLIIYSFGIFWLIYSHKVPIAMAISIGALPFIPGDIIKIFFATIIYSRIARRSKSIFSA